MPETRGSLGLDVDLQASKTTTQGHADVTIAKLGVGRVLRDLDAKLAATFNGRDAHASLDARDAEKDAIALVTDGARLGAGALDPRAWRDATGSVRMTANVDMDRAAGTGESAGAGSLDAPIQKMKGWLTAKLDVERRDARARPTFAFDVRTTHLRFIAKPQTVPAPERDARIVISPPPHVNGVDVSVRGKLDAESGATHVEATLEDTVGKLFDARVDATLPMDALVDRADVKQALVATEIDARAEVPMRSIEDLPPMLKPFSMKGNVGALLVAKGSALAPNVRATVEARDLVDPGDPTPVPVSYEATLTYDGALAKATILANRPKLPRPRRRGDGARGVEGPRRRPREVGRERQRRLREVSDLRDHELRRRVRRRRRFLREDHA